jgi:DNA-binding MarR family transcriptional regulator
LVNAFCVTNFNDRLSTMSALKKIAVPKMQLAEPGASKHVLWTRPGYLVRRLNQIHYAFFYEECHAESMTPVQYGMLTVLAVNPGIDQTTLCQELGLDRTTTADVVKRLESRGYISRQIDPSDRRVRRAFLTAEGLRVMSVLQGGMAKSQERLLQPLSEADRSTFMRLLSRLVHANNQYSRAAVGGI